MVFYLLLIAFFTKRNWLKNTAILLAIPFGIAGIIGSGASAYVAMFGLLIQVILAVLLAMVLKWIIPKLKNLKKTRR